MKYLITVILFITLFSNSIYSQIPKHGVHKDMDLGNYFSNYKDLDASSLNYIKQNLYKTVNYKNIDSLLKNEMEDVKMFSKGWCLLMRMADIDWLDKKHEVIDLLHDFSQQILSGSSYLTLTDLDKYQGEGVSRTHPAFFPFYSYWVMMQIDPDYSLKYVSEMVESENAILGSNKYHKEFKRTLFYFLLKYYKSEKVLRFCRENSEKCGIEDSSILVELKKRHEAYNLKDEGLVWDYLIKADAVSPITSKSVSEWYQNLIFLREIYPNQDFNIFLKKTETSKNYEDTYYLLYSLCFALNGKFSYEMRPLAVKSDAIKAIELVDKYYVEHGAKLKFANDYDDKLKSSCGSLKYKLTIKD